MNTKLLFPAVFGVVLCSACASQMGSPPLGLQGDPAPATAANRTIQIGPGTRHVNVTGGETVNFIVGNKSFAWSFNSPTYFGPVNLKQAAPPGLLDRDVLAYVAPNPTYTHGGRSIGNTHGVENGGSF